MKFIFVLLSVTLFCTFVSATAILPINIKSTDVVFKLPDFIIQPEHQIEERITNGQIAEPGQFPYQVGLRLKIRRGYAWCGGTLISDTFVVTAAHCTQRAESVVVYLGAFDIQNDTETHQQRIFVSKKNIFVHEDWSRLTLQNDISLIKLPVPVEFNNYIQPATLPKKSDTYSTYEGNMTIASGWGLESDNSTAVSRYLRYVEVPILSSKRCNIQFFGVITDDMICIDTTGGKSTCSGDSGGPLVYKEDNINYLIGSTSFGISFGCEIGWPGVFTRTTSYLDWIEKKSGVVNK